VDPPDRIKNKNSKRSTNWNSRPPVFIGVNRVKLLVLFLPHVKGRKFLARPGISRLGLLF
jgi:hypothetical protein